MASICAVPLNPGRKRRASCLEVGYLDAWPKLPATTDTPSTPGLQDVPDLDWADSPSSRETTPDTPPPITISYHDLSLVEGTEYSDTVPRKKLRQADHLPLREALQTIFYAPLEAQAPRIKSSGEEPAPVFPCSIYPVTPPLPSKKSYLVGGDISAKNFKFFELSRFPGQQPRSPRSANSTTRRPSVKSSVLTQINTNEKEPYSPKKFQYDTDTENIYAAVATGPQVRTAQPPGSASRLAHRGVIGSSLLKILPTDVIEKTFTKPNFCVKFCPKKPGSDKRCGNKIAFTRDTPRWLTIQLLNRDHLHDLNSSQDYIRELVESTLCKGCHRAPAHAELDQVLAYIDCQRKGGSRGSCRLNESDIQCAGEWLDAITTLPQSKDLGPQERPTSTSASSKVSKSVARLESTPLRDVEDPGRVKAGRAIVKSSNSASESKNRSALSQSTKTELKLPGESAKVQHIETTKSIKVMQSTEISKETPKSQLNASILATNTAELTQTTHTTKVIAAADTGDVKNGSIVVEKSSSPTKTTETIKHSLGDTKYVTTTTTIVAAHRKEKISTFSPPPIEMINFRPTESTRTDLRRSARIAARVSRPNEPELTTLHQKFIWSNRGKGSSIRDHILETVVKRLTPREYEYPRNNSSKYSSKSLNYPGQGLIYMYWVPGSFGFVKIGKTSGESTAQRLEAWKKKCGHEIQEHTRGEEETAVQLPHAFRVEALVFAELRDFRMEEQCCEGCGKQHIEWFAVSPSHAQKVIEKWSNWILTRPYEYVDRTGEWQLKRSITGKELDAIRTPIDVPNGNLAVLPASLKPTLPETPVKKGKGRKKSTS